MWSIIATHRYFLSFVFIASLVVRLIFFFSYTTHDTNYMLFGDSEQYADIANNLVCGNGFSMSPETVNFYEPTTFYRLPGYPIFLSVIQTLFHGDQCKAMALQCVLASLVPVLMFVLSLLIFPGAVRCARLVAMFSVLHVGFVMYAGILSTEALFLLLFLLFCIVLLQSSWVSAGVLLGLASLVRPMGHYIVILIVFYMLLIRLKGYLSFVLSWLVTVSPWLIRNFLLTGALFFHSLPGLHFLQYSAVGVVTQRDDCSYFQGRDVLFAQWHKRVHTQEKKLGRALNEYEYYSVAQSLATQTILAHPWLAAKHAIVQIVRTCGTLYSSLLIYVAPGTVYDNTYSLWDKMKIYFFPNTVRPGLAWVVYLELIVSIGMLFGCALGIWKLLCGGNWHMLFLLVIPACFFIVITLSYGCARLRMQADVFFILLAAYGLSTWCKKKEKRV